MSGVESAIEAPMKFEQVENRVFVLDPIYMNS